MRLTTKIILPILPLVTAHENLHFLTPPSRTSAPSQHNHIMTKFRPCIDLHSGQVKQIVGGTLTTQANDLKTNYVSTLPAGHFAKLYKNNGLEGAHVIMLGPGNEEAAKEALAEWPDGLQIGGGITDKNAKQWIDWGAERVCKTSWLKLSSSSFG
jgi:phosphoribosylformimino-5-aminoimidazole carboxamide ribotide isomerase